MKKIFYLMLAALTMGSFTACDDDEDIPEIINPTPDDDNAEDTPPIVNPAPKEQWGKTLRGDDQSLLAFPDIYANYWEYTYSYKDHPNIGLRLTGKFPKARFFNFTVYNDETQVDMSSIEDVNIQPDENAINPYVTETSDYASNGYTVYIIPAGTPASMRASMKNVCEFPDDLNMVSIFMRLYLAKQYSGDEYGGAEMPAIQAFDVTTGKDVEFPKREVCNIHESLIMPPMNFSADLPQLPFMRAPLSLMYPNGPAEYLFARIKLNEGEVATFRFIPPTAPKSVSEYATADVRYWSICLGSAESYSYVSIYDEEMPKLDKEGFVTFVIADANSAKLADLQAKADANDGTYLLKWNRKEHGDGILALYRNMVINENYPHSMRELMEPVPLAAAGGDMSGFKPQKMLAKFAMGKWGPQGHKFSEEEFLSDSFNYEDIRGPELK
ncbi:hypothetical protein [Parabacteroides sp. ZJ-118]|uniref:hypothetical protein n=1 Tax=Parabacteroides sp. ZJ-118 TaxID=2709398 RepID=UPI0013ED3925|nr:hypothetical protein [Parabacteroides sp. ZJ-118]